MLLDGEKIETSLKLARLTDLSPIKESDWNRKLNINLNDEGAAETLTAAIKNILKVVVAKQKSKEYGFICLFTDGSDNYWLKVSRGLSTALNESLASLESLVDKDNFFTEEQQDEINAVYRMLNELFK